LVREGGVHLVWKLKGVDELTTSLRQIAGRVEAAAEAEILAAGKDIEAKSRELVPELTTALRESHRTDTERQGRRFRVNIQAGPTFGEDGRDYSLRIHEGFGNPERPPAGYFLGPISSEKNGNRTPHVGDGVGWKFMERAFDFHSKMIVNRIAAKIREQLR